MAIQIPDHMFVQTVLPGAGQPGSRPEELRAFQIQASPADFGAQVGQAVQGLGQTMERAGEQTAQSVLLRRQFFNETAANDHLNQFENAFRDQYQKYYALQGRDAVDQYPAYQERMQDLQRQYRDALTNPAQQRLFDQFSRQRVWRELDGMSRYADQQNKVWEAQTSDATVQRYINQAADKYNDAVIFEGARKAMLDEAQRYGLATGQSAEVFHERAQKAVDKLYADVIARHALTDPAAANIIFQAGIKLGDISGTAQLEIASHLKNPLQIWDARNFVNGLVGSGSFQMLPPGEVQISPSARIATVHNNPGNLMWANQPGAVQGEPKAGGGYWAKFESPEAGWQAELRQIEIDKRDHPEYTLSQLINKYAPASDKNDPQWYAKTVAGALRISPDTPITQIPTEALGREIVKIESGTSFRTSGSVQVPASSQMTADLSGQTVPQQSGDFIRPAVPPRGQWRVEDLEAALPEWEKAVIARYADNPVAQAQALGMLHSTVNAQVATLKRVAQADENALWRIYADPNGPRDLQAVLSVPGNQEIYNRVRDANPKVVISFNEAMAKKAGEQATPINEKTIARFYELAGEARTDQDTFLKRNLMDEYKNVPLSGLNKLFEMRQGILVHRAAEEAHNWTLKNALGSVQDLVEAYGIYDPFKPSNEQSGDYKQFVSRFAEGLNEFEEANKRSPRNIELREMANDLIRKVKVPGKYWGEEEVPVYQLTPGQQTRAKMPQEQVPGYTDDFKKAYGRDPFPGELDQLYFATRLHPGDKEVLRRIDALIRQNSLRLIPVSRTAGPQATSSQSPGPASEMSTGERLQQYLLP
ncbi:MAG TPA: hypothetical protein VEF34_03770 [Syntrophobacteraceae bacterium]|nr:hypothetical protein [Syntrophobacteraceae bacterium]